MSTRHIVQVSAYHPPHLGGQENVVAELSQQLARAGHSVTVLTSNIGGGAQGTCVEKGVAVTRMRGLVFGHAPIMPWLPLALWRAAHIGSVVHVHVGQAFTPEIVWLVSKFRHFKYIIELHIDFVPSGPTGILLPLYKRFILKRVLRSAASVIVLNQKTLRIVRETYGYTGRVRVMNNGIDEDYFALEQQPFAAHPPQTLHLLFVGRLSKQKNVCTLLDALKQTKRKVHLDIVGEGDERQSIVDAVAAYGLTNVTLHGRLARDKVMQFYQTADALIMPSLYEAQPLVLLEAMAARIPIIGTNVVGVADHIMDAGIIVEPTADGLAEGIDRYYESYSFLPKMVQHGFEAAEEFRWPRTLKRYEALYAATMEN